MLKIFFILLIVTVIGVVLLTHPHSDLVKSNEDAALQPVLPAGTAGPEHGGLAKTYVEPVLLSAGSAGPERGGWGVIAADAIAAKSSVDAVLLSAGTAGPQFGAVAGLPVTTASPAPKRPTPSNYIPPNCRERVNLPGGGWYFKNRCRSGG